LQTSSEEQRLEKQRQAAAQEQEAAKKKEEEEREKLKAEWLNLLFTDQSVAAMSPEGPLPSTMEAGNTTNPKSLLVWIGDNVKAEGTVLKTLPGCSQSAAILQLAWSQHPAGEAFQEFNLKAPEVVDGSFYLRDRTSFENQDLDMMHDVELLGRSLVESLEPKIGEYGLDWSNVVIMGFGKGAGIALYAALLKLFPKPISSMILFSPIVLFPSYLGEKLTATKSPTIQGMKIFTVWGNRNRSTPGTYRQLLSQTLRKAPGVQCTPDTLPDGDHSFDAKSMSILESLVPLCVTK